MKTNITNGNCWVVYLDILGFKNMLQQHSGDLGVFVDVWFNDVIRTLGDRGNYNPDYISVAWFSDSFLLFSHDDTLTSFVEIERAARYFYWEVVCMGIPLRGALGFGEFYGDLSKSIFLGHALIETYQYAEQQNWIGFIVTPSTNKQLDGSDISLSQSEYVQHRVVFKQKAATEEDTSEMLYAYKPKPGMLEPMLQKIVEMQSMAKHQHPDRYASVCKSKYERTIAFLES